MVGEGVAAADLTPDAFLHRVEQTLEAEARTVDPERARAGWMTFAFRRMPSGVLCPHAMQASNDGKQMDPCCGVISASSGRGAIVSSKSIEAGTTIAQARV